MHIGRYLGAVEPVYGGAAAPFRNAQGDHVRAVIIGDHSHFPIGGVFARNAYGADIAVYHCGNVLVHCQMPILGEADVASEFRKEAIDVGRAAGATENLNALGRGQTLALFFRQSHLATVLLKRNFKRICVEKRLAVKRCG